METSKQGHKLDALFEETDHAVQFQKGRLGFFDVGGGKWSTSISYDLNDEIDNKIWTANAVNAFGSNSDYKETLYGLNSKIVNGASRKYISRKVGIHYGNLSRESVNVFQAIQIVTDGSISEGAARSQYMNKGGFGNVLIGVPRK